MPKPASRDTDWRSIVDEIDWTQVGERLGLSQRELQVVRGTLEGKSMAETATHLNLAVGTVKTYSGRIHAKLGVSNQCQLTLVVLHESLSTALGTADSGSGRLRFVRARAAT